MFTSGGIFIRNPRIRNLVEGEEGTGSEAGEGAEEKTEEGPKFPANTPVKDMTPEQQAAYHENKARKLEDKLKSFNGLTPKQIADIQRERDELRTKSQSAEDRAIDDAKEAGRAEVRAELAAERVKNALEKALTGRMPDAGALLDLDRSQFITDGRADTEAIAEWVEKHSTEPDKKKNPDLGQGRRSGSAASGGIQAGRDRYEQKHPRKDK
jgi:hypothetical protein